MEIDTEEEVTLQVICPYCGKSFEETQIVPITVTYEPDDWASELD